ncbi:MAG: hypothetical protein WA996_22995 [Candidatus Promineifilaceae bacterium]
MLRNYLNKIAESIDNDEDEAIQAELLRYASEDRDAFIAEVRAIPPEEMPYLSDIYEALSFDPVPWSGFYLDEVDRLLEQARRSQDPAEILEPLDAFWLLSLDEDALQLRQDLLGRFSENLDDENIFIRRKCVVLVGDFVGRKDFKVLNKLELLVQSDPDWRVRYLAYQALEDVHPKRAERVKLPLWIRLRARYSNVDYE